MLALGCQLYDRFLSDHLNRHSPRDRGAAFGQLLHFLPRTPDSLAELSMRGFEPAHTSTLLFQVSESLQAVLGLKPVQAGVSLTKIGIGSRPSGIGNLTGRIVRDGRILRQRIRRVLLAQIFKEIF